MKKKEKTELRQLKVAELEKKLATKRKDLLGVKIKLSQGQLKNYRQINQLKDEIAIILTIIKEKQLLEEAGLAVKPEVKNHG